MKGLLLAAALLAGGFVLATDLTPAMAQAGGGGGAAGGAGSDVATPQKSAPRAGAQKRDDSMKSGMKIRKHSRHKKKTLAKKIM